MRGEIVSFDQSTGVGEIQGEDGGRYAFARAEFFSVLQIHPCMKVEFGVQDGRAVRIYVLSGQVIDTIAAEPEPRLSLWGYFVRAITSKYFDGTGRARRKEAWGAILFLMLISFVLNGVSIALVISEFGGLPEDFGPKYFPLLMTTSNGMIAVGLQVALILMNLYLIIPTVTLTSRRFHDVGASGWWTALLLLSPTVFIFIGPMFVAAAQLLVTFAWIGLCLWPGQRGENQYGPDPRG